MFREYGIFVKRNGVYMAKLTVWTRQHRDVWKALEETGRHIAKREYINMDLQEHSNLVLEVYDWLAKNGPDSANRPADVSYPVWISLVDEATMIPGENEVVLELSIEEEQVTKVNIAKWGAILNYSYIPLDDTDAKRHRGLLEAYGTNDAKAFMTPFYPEIKREIMASWKRLFDDSIQLGNDLCYGNIWEIKREWVTKVRK